MSKNPMNPREISRDLLWGQVLKNMLVLAPINR